MRTKTLAIVCGALIVAPTVAASVPRHEAWHPSCQHLPTVQRAGCNAADDRWSYAGTVTFDDGPTGHRCWQRTADPLNAYFDCPNTHPGIAGAGSIPTITLPGGAR